ncbi:MAG: hypothetical protein HYY84_07420 [Deltaproteobacteria bacterium]|nr:hypothetical protein [Deltaproteobacteria bacterium]
MESKIFAGALRAALQERWSEVRNLLEHAVSIDGADPELRVLLARALVRQGFAFKAIDILEATPGLFDDSAAAASAGAELGVLLLKLGRTVDAEETFRRVLASAPNAARAHAGLGHLFRYRGEIGLAGQAFARAENAAVIREVERDIATSAPSIDGNTLVAVEPDRGGDNPFDRGAAPFGVESSWVVKSSGSAHPNARAAPRAGLRDSLQALPTPAADHVFSPNGAWLGVRCAERVFARLPRIVCADAHLAWLAETARVNGQATEQPLGGEVPIHRIEGDGNLTLALPASTALARIDLAGETIYVNEEALFGFSGGLEWENGTLDLAPSPGALSLVFLEGTGEVLLVASGGFTRLAVERGHSISVAGENLVGWTGRIVPSATVWNDAAGRPVPTLHLSGDGTALIALRPGLKAVERSLA